MDIPLQITVRDMGRSEALTALIRKDAEKLEKLQPDITRCKVVVEEGGRHRQQGRHFSVHLEVRVPGRETLVSTREHADAHVAVRDAFEAARRQLS